jgi:hypothetical protein
MGSPLSPVIANYFMEYFEEMALASATYKPLSWFRYVDVVMKISRKNLNRKIFPFFIRTVDMVSLFTFYNVIIMLIHTSPFILIGR